MEAPVTSVGCEVTMETRVEGRGPLGSGPPLTVTPHVHESVVEGTFTLEVGPEGTVTILPVTVGPSHLPRTPPRTRSDKEDLQIT